MDFFQSIKFCKMNNFALIFSMSILLFLFNHVLLIFFIIIFNGKFSNKYFKN